MFTKIRNSLLLLFCSASTSLAGWNAEDGTYTWDPLVTPESFSGIFGDLKTAILALLTIVFIMLGVGLLIKSLRS